MKNEIILKLNTQTGVDSKRKDILELYGISSLMDNVVTKEKNNFFNFVRHAGVAGENLANLGDKKYMVEIPCCLREMLKEGKAAFDKSKISPGNFTPNIRIVGESGIEGQAIIVEGIDPDSLRQGISNLAMMAVLQSVVNKLEVVEEKLDDIKKGQTNDRIAKVIGAFNSYKTLYSGFKSNDELITEANRTYAEMQQGLTALHLEIDEYRKKIENYPVSEIKFLIECIKNFFGSFTDKYRQYYYEFIRLINIYSRLLLMSDIVLFSKGDVEAIMENHRRNSVYCGDFLNCDFHKVANFLMDNKTESLEKILQSNYEVDNALKSLIDVENCNLRIECDKEDLKRIYG